MMSDLLELAARCEAATGPDRELDWLIAQALNEIPEHTIAVTGVPYGWYRRPNEFALWRTKESDPRAGVDLWQPAKRTASLDTAMILVPEGWGYCIRSCGPSENAAHFARLYSPDFYSVTRGKGENWITDVLAGQEAISRAATPALALCAAALRARAA